MRKMVVVYTVNYKYFLFTFSSLLIIHRYLNFYPEVNRVAAEGFWRPLVAESPYYGLASGALWWRSLLTAVWILVWPGKDAIHAPATPKLLAN